MTSDQRAILNRRHFLVGCAACVGCSMSANADSEIFTPEAFGASGDGKTDDTDAFVALSQHLNKSGGGTVLLRRATYIVGKQALGGKNRSYRPSPILDFQKCSRPVSIVGNGAVLRAAPGLRFGTFDPSTGRPFEHAMPFYEPKGRASPYEAMINIERCSGSIAISDLELDGNLGALQIGGKWGNRGWQIGGSGIRLVGNSGPERIERVYVHHHPLDGLLILGAEDRTTSTLISDVVSEYNGRQGCTVSSGRNYNFERCRFSRTGKGGLQSAPGAGVDIEAGHSKIRDLRFSGCEFSDNDGVGVVADTGNSAGALFDDCRFIGTTRWSAWPDKPLFRFVNCLFVGSLAHPKGDADPLRAAQFSGCRFRDDPSLSPTGQVYGGTGKSRPIVLAPSGRNIMFAKCDFTLTAAAVLPFTNRNVIYSDCTMSQRSPELAHPNGTFIGTNRIDGNVDLSRSAVKGELVVNGRSRVGNDAQDSNS
ncbi:MAG TPA: right-handed parallel beta-helix repeat-containing protein [Sphingomicrobium sp.]|nr:right-handed parallel beta-helix repeat-containing protein [Sphingomicrobium sp.]